MRWLTLTLFVLALELPAQPDPSGGAAPAEQDEATLEQLRAYEKWLRGYKVGAFRLVKNDRDDPEAVAQVNAVMAALASWNNMPAAKKLFEAASVNPELPGATSSTDRVTFYREVQPWRIRRTAQDHIVKMTAPGIDEWLLGILRQAFTDRTEGDDQIRSAAMRIVGRRGGVRGMMTLVEATQRLPKSQRVAATSALSQIANMETVEHFIGLLRDVEPNVRIAALNALGRAIGPAVDETVHDPRKLDKEIVELRDKAVEKMTRVLVRDKVWQVRAAAGENLARLKTKHAVPALIDGLDAELKRKKDPWAMDMRLHRLLEGMTGTKMATGQVKQWQRFWKENKGVFSLTASAEAARKSAERAKSGSRVYQKFFNIDLESDRVLFVLDFSGSMVEPVTLTTGGTAASREARTMIKAKLVVEELKRIVMLLPEGTLFNVIVFSEEVRVWRPAADGRPRPVPIDDDARDDLLGSFFDNLQPAGATNLHGALDCALDFDHKGAYDRYYQKGFDTLYVMSDGGPTWGDVIETDEILRLVRETNALRKMTIHTVTFGDQNEMRFLKRLAEQNGGRHIHVE